MLSASSQAAVLLTLKGTDEAFAKPRLRNSHIYGLVHLQMRYVAPSAALAPACDAAAVLLAAPAAA